MADPARTGDWSIVVTLVIALVAELIWIALVQTLWAAIVGVLVCGLCVFGAVIVLKERT